MNISKFEDCDAFSDYLIESLLANGSYVTKEFNDFTGLDWPINTDVWEHNTRFGLPKGTEYFKYGSVRAYFYDLYFIQKWVNHYSDSFSIIDSLKANRIERYSVQGPIMDERDYFKTLLLSSNPLHPQGLNHEIFKPLRKSGKFLKLDSLPSDCKRAVYNAFNLNMPLP